MLQTTLELPCGLRLKNRLVKAATTEGLSNDFNQATPELARVWQAWAERGDVGMILTGNIHVDRRFLERPGNVVLDPAYPALVEQGMGALNACVRAGQTNDTKVIAQVSHAGRQANPDVCKLAIAPSKIQLVSDVPHSPCEEMSTEMIAEAIEKFAFAAQKCEESGFDGIQLHAAHGYLLSSFLNPLANIREDDFGGSTRKRAEFLLRVIRAVKAVTRKINPKFSIGVKLNSADFQKGGFSVEDCLIVAELLAREQIDFLELSGGNYEQPAMMTGGDDEVRDQLKDTDVRAESTVKREAYFLEFAEKIAQFFESERIKLPLIVTGGFRSHKAMEDALRSKACELIGVARPLCFDLDCTKRLLNGEIDSLPRAEENWRLPWFLGFNFMQKNKFIQKATMGALQMMMYQNIIDLGFDKYKPQTEEKYPNLLFNLVYRVLEERKKSNKLKGMKWDKYLQNKYKNSRL